MRNKHKPAQQTTLREWLPIIARTVIVALEWFHDLHK